MDYAGMTEAAGLLGVADRTSARRILVAAGVEIHRPNAKTLLVHRDDLARVVAARAASGYTGRGRPRKKAPEATE